MRESLARCPDLRAGGRNPRRRSGSASALLLTIREEIRVTQAVFHDLFLGKPRAAK
jgi:hypothetical protein